MAEPLREVAEELARARIDLLREEPQIVRVPEQLVHRLACLGDTARTRERLDDPERARHEGALDLLLAGVAVEERAAGSELAADRVDRRSHQLAVGIDEAGPGGPEGRRVELVGAGVEGEAPVAGGETARLDEVAERLLLFGPAIGVVVGKLVVARKADPAIEGDPSHQLRDRVVAKLRKLPDARVLVTPDDAEPVERRGDPLAGRLVEGVSLAQVQR